MSMIWAPPKSQELNYIYDFIILKLYTFGNVQEKKLKGQFNHQPMTKISEFIKLL